MGNKTIRVNLNTRSLNDAIREVRKYRAEIERKTKLFQRRVADEIEALAQEGFNGAIVDDLIPSEMNPGRQPRKAQVSMTVDEQSDYCLVIANGEDAVWVEFGAGVYHNGEAGNSPHPNGKELQFTIGSFGNGNGKRETWGFYEGEGPDKTLVLTHGTPAAMPMYNAMKQVCDRIEDIAKEVFG